MGAVPALSQNNTMSTDSSAHQLPNNPDAKPEFEFRGHKIGEHISVKFPRWNMGGKDSCSNFFDKDIFLCDDKTTEVKTKSGIKYNKVGDVEISGISYMFFDEKLFGFDMSFRSDDFINIRSMLVGKYGTPSRENSDSIKSMAGASFDNIITEWDFKEGVLRLVMRHNKIDKASLSFKNPEALSLIGRRKGAQNQAKGKSVF